MPVQDHTMYNDFLNEIETFWEFLPDKPEEDPEGILKTLWLTAAGTPTSIQKAKTKLLPELNDEKILVLKQLIDTKRSGIPLAHISKRATFLELDFITGPEALIPRVETEILGKNVLAKLRMLTDDRGPLKVIDVCTGCGNLALSYAHYTPNATVYGADLSENAVSLAQKNATQLGLANRVTFQSGDLFAPFSDGSFLGSCDLVSCNPPYISTAKVSKMHKEISSFEPELAFNGGVFGISVLSRMIKEGPEFLKPGSWLCFELGLGQGPAIVAKLKKDSRFSTVESYTDCAENIRAILAQTV